MKTTIRTTPLLYICLLLTINCALAQQNSIRFGNLEWDHNLWIKANEGAYTKVRPPLPGDTTPGQYAYVNDPADFNTAFISGGDHTTGSGIMMAFDGSTTAGQQTLFSPFPQADGICFLTPGETYYFTYWIKSISTDCTDATTLANINLRASNSNNITLVDGHALASLPIDGWQKVTYSLVPESSCIVIELYNNNTNTTGNDFALDDFEFTTALSFTHSVSADDCSKGKLSSVYVYSKGVPASYKLTGTVEMTNYDPFFHNVPDGTYVIEVTDVHGVTATSAPFTVAATGSRLIVPQNKNICAGTPVTLSASGSNGHYIWTASPPDTSLPATETASVTVAPLNTTTYTVTSPAPNVGENLIYNGDFSLGNVGFISKYTYRNTNSMANPQSYGVINNPMAWNPSYTRCGDHTTGNGNMLAVKGNANNNDIATVWRQNVYIREREEYVFSFWVQSLTPLNPARFNVLFSGQSALLNAAAPATIQCGSWVQVTATYRNMSAFNNLQIEIVDLETNAIGNGFAIDDIEFKKAIPCNIVNTVTVNVTNSLAPAYYYEPARCIYPGRITINKAAAEYSFDGGQTWQTSDTKDGLAAGNYQLMTRSGSNCVSDIRNFTLPGYTELMATQYGSVQATCLRTYYRGYIEINEPGPDYSFDGGLTWTTNNIIYDLIPNHEYLLLYRNSDGCVSEINSVYGESLTPTPDTPIFSVNHPGSCNVQTGIITVTSVFPRYEYSFDDGLTWSSDNVSPPLLPGTYYVMSKTFMGCQSYPAVVVINQPSPPPAAPQVRISNPTCTVATGTVTVNTPASQYSFDDGVTWITNAVLQLPPGSYKVKVKDSNGCESLATIAVIDDTGKPAAPAFTTVQPNCVNATGTITITNNATAYSFDGINWVSQNTMPGLREGIYNIKIKNVWGCESDAVQVAIARTTVTYPVAPTPITYCKDAPAVALTATGTNLLWYATAFGGQGTSTAPVPQTNVAGTVTYYVTQTLNGCESSTVAINVITLPLLLPPVTTPVNYCLNENTVALTAAGTNLLWYANEFDGTGSPVAPIPLSAALGTSVYYVSQTVNSCESNRARITVTINPVPAAPVTQVTVIYPHNAATTALTAQGSGITWYNEAMLEMAGAPTPSSATIGQRVYYATQTANRCESTAVKIIVEIVPNYFAVKFPKYFTPNGDGTHETWNITNTGNEMRVISYIFDRYGKLVTQVFSPGVGWDGTLNGYPLPSSDYWFTTFYTEYGVQKQVRSHFSLIR